MQATALIDFPLTATLSSFIFAVPLVAVVAFASTNVDDLFLLASLFIDKEFRTIPIVAGQFLGMFFLVAFSVMAALLAISIQGDWNYWLGLAPLLLGIGRLCDLFEGSLRPDSSDRHRLDFVGKERLRSGWIRSEIVFVAGSSFPLS